MDKAEIIKIIVTAVVSASVTGLITYARTLKKSVLSLKEGVLSLLRAELIRSNEKYHKKGYCPLYAKEALEKAFKAYSGLGGNGAMKKVYEDTMNLPTEEQKGA